MRVHHEFVTDMPPQLQRGVIYVSIPHTTVLHLCACGCGHEVATPLSPNDWSLTFDGESISLDPSIGNWSFPCRSHYWVSRNTIVWAGNWSAQTVRNWRRREARETASYYAVSNDRHENRGGE